MVSERVGVHAFQRTAARDRARRPCARSCGLMPIITTKSECIDHWTKMYRSLGRFCGLEMYHT